MLFRKINRRFNSQWSFQIAEIFRLAWSCEEGIFYFPYFKFGDPNYWLNELQDRLNNQTMFSWVHMCNGKIIANVSLISVDGHWEIGRMVCHPRYQGNGVMTNLVRKAIDFANNHNLEFVIECSHANTFTQAICEKLQLRFAGIGILHEGDGIDVSKASWDILYYDNLEITNFKPSIGVLSDQFGIPRQVAQRDLPRLHEIGQMISTEPGGQLPPSQFHVLPKNENIVRQIIKLAISYIHIGV